MADNLSLPEDILNKVVVWLPAKSFYRCKCLSKYWNKVIPYSFREERPGRRIMVLPVQPFHAIDIMVPYGHRDHVIIKRHCSPFGNLEGKSVIVVGTFNGILLLAFKNQFPGHMMLYNPFTEECEMVPDPPLCDHTFTYNYGLGYASTIDDLKIFVFRHIRYIRYGPNDVDTSCHVFSFKERSWSITSLWERDDDEDILWDVNYKYDFIHDAGTFVNGFLYWHVIKHEYGRMILALDLRSMLFSEIKFPLKDGLRKKKKKRLTSNFPFPSIILGTLGGFLSIVCSNSSKLEVWVSKTHEFEESWEKRYTSTLVARGNYLYKFEPFSILDDGKIVMLKRPNQVIILDILNDSDKEANIVTTLSEISGTQAIEYIETFVSPYDILRSSVEDNEQHTLEDNEQDILKDDEQDTLEDDYQHTLEDDDQCTLEDDDQDTLEDDEQDTLEDDEQDTLGDDEQDTPEDDEKDTFEDDDQYTEVGG